MKKFFISFLIVLIFSAVVFFIGWTQIKVKSDTVGVVMSKTSGICNEPVVPGKFSWNWQFLLPTNAQLKTYSIKPYNATKTVSGQLPSGDLYSVNPESFSYKFTYSIGITVSPEMVVSLLKENKIFDEKDLTDYMNNAADSIAQLATEYLLKKAEDNPSFRAESVRRDDILRSIQIYQEFPEIDLTAFAITESKIPDYKLYSKLQNQVFLAQDKYLQNLNSDLSAATTTESQNSENSEK